MAAIFLGPTLDENGEIDPVTGLEAVFHFFAIGWKVLFALVPPPKLLGGWAAFVVALAFIGIVTAVVGEFANLFGCVIGLKQAITAITFVALGTSLPDTFASMQAAQQSSNADSAIGNVTGSNSVNVFLGLGLPWLIATLYWRNELDEQENPKDYEVPPGDLSFSVAVFLIVSIACIAILMLRRLVSSDFFTYNSSLVANSAALSSSSTSLPSCSLSCGSST